MILQLNPTITVKCKDHGDGEAILVIDYGVNVNTVWVVRLPGGKIKHFYSDDILIYDNPMNGNGWDITGDITEEIKGNLEKEFMDFLVTNEWKSKIL